ncbi:hypothetical protein Mal4_33290 [Maioricimonas rarisocia]|uniref:Lipoprotein n=1 Tax=Maioricimonas rarisocia TaxID=2528026 RepID=A0A517Z955_9PLAN|nr:hypothetical protein [Maioricimonas rarisocia]QDU38996.1 hypothetical protein Mal4_33290 [Maioricimonas rarisocia]
MNRRVEHRPWLLLSLPLACLLLGGCGQSVAPEILALREQLIVPQEPQGAITIEQARQQVEDDPNVTLTVKVGNRNFPEWSAENQATFYVSEGFPGSDYNVGPDHDPSTCPFCKWKWKEEDSLAVVHVVDESGEVLPYSAETVLDVAPGSTLTIQGDGSVDESGFLNVRLTGLFVHP